jgi:hypothetical protein
MEGPGKQYPYEKTGGLEPGRFKPIEEPGAEEKDPTMGCTHPVLSWLSGF